MKKRWLILISFPLVIIVFFVAVSFSLKTSQTSEGQPGDGSLKKQLGFFESFKAKVTKSKDVCLTNEEYEKIADPNAPLLSMPFSLED